MDPGTGQYQVRAHHCSHYAACSTALGGYTPRDTDSHHGADHIENLQGQEYPCFQAADAYVFCGLPGDDHGNHWGAGIPHCKWTLETTGQPGTEHLLDCSHRAGTRYGGD